MTHSDTEKHTLKWRFDVNTFRLIGRDLITDRITALFELVKNCYDANAKRVDIIFNNVSTKFGSGFIEIRDDGEGMSLEDIRDKWMVIGTNSKRKKHYSDPPFNRRYVGEKGIGRFAVDKLGGELLITTKKQNQNQSLNVKVNWNEYEKLANQDNMILFTDVENYYYYQVSDMSVKGTNLNISELNEIWTKSDIDRLYRELTKIVSPFYPLNPPFNIYITSNEFEFYTDKLVESDAVQFASHTAQLTFHSGSNKQEVLKFNNISGKIYTSLEDYKIFGPVKLQLYYFDESAKRKFNNVYKDSQIRIDGIKIYRDGIVTTPFAEFEEHPDKKRDILGIDKRLWRDIFNRISTREVIGVLDITKEFNPCIIDATNRQDFVDNIQYRELKNFIIEQLNIFSEVKKYEREITRVTVGQALQRAEEDVSMFTKTLLNLEREKPELKPVLEPLRQQAKVVNNSITKGISEQKKSQQEFSRKENIYLSLMSLQEYAIHIAHAVRTSLGKVKRMAGFFVDHFPDPEFDAYFIKYAKLIYSEMDHLNKAIDFMLSYAGSTVSYEDFNVKDFFDHLMHIIYGPLFEAEGITTTVNIYDDITINTNKKFLEDIVENLVSNSVKALKNQSEKIIKCSGFVEGGNLLILFSDNGAGIKFNDRERIFDIYYTTTAGEGGAGVGLFVVKTRVEAMNGTIEIVESEFGEIGVTFRIILPFNSER